jgi:hypothetical protein
MGVNLQQFSNNIARACCGQLPFLAAAYQRDTKDNKPTNVGKCTLCTAERANARIRGLRFVFGTVLVMIAAAQINAQEPPADPQAESHEDKQQEERSTGLPNKVKWTFNFDAAWGTFGFANSLYTNVRPDPSGNLSDNWFEGFIKPALSATIPLEDNGELYGKLSAVGERTYGAPPSLVGESASSFKQEDIYAGWRSGAEDSSAIDLTIGRAPFKIGHGFLVWDGAGEGGSRGGFWSNARKAWRFAGIARLKPGKHTLEGFYLERDDVPENDTGSRLTGVNYEYSPAETSTFGLTYLRTFAHPSVLRDRDGMDVFNARAFTAPIPQLADLSFDAEYAYEENHRLLRSTAWYAQGAYQLSKVAWKPKLSYRYAFFQGDDPRTATNEAFDPLYVGFYDWGTWWQGEIAGEYFLLNSNLISHQVRIHMTPSDRLGWGVIGYWFRLPRPSSFGPTGVTSSDAALEVDTYADWKINKNFTLSLVGAFADPGKAVQQAYNRTDNFVYGMVYIAYSF